MGTHTIAITDWHPSPLNKLLRGWRQAARLKKLDREMVWAYAHAAGVPKATGKRSLQVTITLEKGQRAFDPDSPFKSLCDALVHCGILTDDNRQGVEILPIKFERGERKATVIVLEDLA